MRTQAAELFSTARKKPKSDMDWPRITIVTPTYNRAEYLEEAILSVLNQDYPNLEYIIVDGGSTNVEVLKIIRKYENKLAWWISEPDRGHAEAIRKGFERATGQVLAWLCSDDKYLPGALVAVGEVFRNRPDADVVYGNSVLIDGHGQFLRELRAVPYSRLGIFTHLNLHQPATFWTCSIYDRVGGQVGGRNLEFNVYEPNADLFFRFANAGARFVLLRRPITCMRIHPGQTSLREPGKGSQHAWMAAEREFPFWTRPGIYQALKFFMKARQLYYHVRQGEMGYLAACLRARLGAARSPAVGATTRGLGADRSREAG